MQRFSANQSCGSWCRINVLQSVLSNFSFLQDNHTFGHFNRFLAVSNYNTGKRCIFNRAVNGLFIQSIEVTRRLVEH